MGDKKVPNPKKVMIRKDVDERLAAMTDDDRRSQSRIITEKVLNHPKYKSAKRIGIFLSLPTEVDTMPILEDIMANQKAPFVPQYSKGQMRMLRVLPGDLDIMVETSWKIKQHGKDLAREDSFDNGGLDLVIAPGAAFTSEGWRVGHGGGYYDRYLTSLISKHQADPGFMRPYILAVCFKQQIYPEVPVDVQDVQVNEVVTA